MQTNLHFWGWNFCVSCQVYVTCFLLRPLEKMMWLDMTAYTHSSCQVALCLTFILKKYTYCHHLCWRVPRAWLLLTNQLCQYASPSFSVKLCQSATSCKPLLWTLCHSERIMGSVALRPARPTKVLLNSSACRNIKQNKSCFSRIHISHVLRCHNGSTESAKPVGGYLLSHAFQRINDAWISRNITLR